MCLNKGLILAIIIFLPTIFVKSQNAIESIVQRVDVNWSLTRNLLKSQALDHLHLYVHHGRIIGEIIIENESFTGEAETGSDNIIKQLLAFCNLNIVYNNNKIFKKSRSDFLCLQGHSKKTKDPGRTPGQGLANRGGRL